MRMDSPPESGVVLGFGTAIHGLQHRSGSQPAARLPWRHREPGGACLRRIGAQGAALRRDRTRGYASAVDAVILRH